MRILLIFLILGLCSCNSWVNLAPDTSWFFSPKEASTENSFEAEEPYIFLQSSDKNIPLSQFNRSKFILTLSDKIFFPFISKSIENSKFYDFDKIKEGEAFKLKISSLCTSVVSGDKVVKEFFGFEHKSHFTFLHIIPEEVLVSSEEQAFTCSFIFSFKDKNQDADHYIVTQQPIISSHQDKGLVLKNTINEKINMYSPIKVKDVESTSLIKQDDELLDRYRFICDNFEKSISFQLKDLEDSFLLHIASQKNLPSGVQSCRIISEKLGFTHGMTQLFRINFDKLTSTEKILDISKINYEFFNKGNKMLTSSNESFSYSHIIRDKKTYPFSTIRFTGLPEDFSSNTYKDVQVEVQSSCSSDLVPEVAENNYQFLLNEEFSLMSVTPEWFFQLYYQDKYIAGNISRSKSIKDYGKEIHDRLDSKKDIECIYEISLKSYDSSDRKIVVTLPKTHHVIEWSSSSYGVTISDLVRSDKEMVRGFGSEYENAPSHLSSSILKKEQAGYFNLIFLNQLAYKNSWNSYPDKMTLQCDSKNDLKAENFNLNFFSLDRLGSSIPMSLIFSHSLFVDYLNENKILKCRLLFYADNVLQYFSSELRIVK